MEKFTTYLLQNNYSPVTATEYQRQTELFAAWHNGEAINCQKKDILNYLSYLKTTKKLAPISRNNELIALRHYFDYLLDQNRVVTNPTSLIKLRGLNRRKLKHIFDLEELTQLADNCYHIFIQNHEQNKLPKNKQHTALLSRQRNYQILLFFIHQGLIIRQVLELQTDDIQLNKATVIIPKGSSRGNARTIQLHATQIGSLNALFTRSAPAACQPRKQLTFFTNTTTR